MYVRRERNLMLHFIHQQNVLMCHLFEKKKEHRQMGYMLKFYHMFALPHQIVFTGEIAQLHVITGCTDQIFGVKMFLSNKKYESSKDLTKYNIHRALLYSLRVQVFTCSKNIIKTSFVYLSKRLSFKCIKNENRGQYSMML